MFIEIGAKGSEISACLTAVIKTWKELRLGT